MKRKVWFYIMKKSFFILLILFVCGIISADVCIEVIGDSTVLLNLDTYTQYANANLAFDDVFWGVLYERVKLFSILIILCFTPIKEHISSVLICLFSFIWGFFLMTCIQGLGVAGIVLGIASVIPHGFLYGGIIIMLLQKNRRYNYHIRDKIVKNIGMILFMVLLFVTGCVIESLVSTHFIPWVIRLSLI